MHGTFGSSERPASASTPRQDPGTCVAPLRDAPILPTDEMDLPTAASPAQESTAADLGGRALQRRTRLWQRDAELAPESARTELIRPRQSGGR